MDKKDKSGPGPVKKLERAPEPLEDEIADDFAERQDLSHAGGQTGRDRLDEQHAKSPELSGGDAGAPWDRPDSGEETVSGHAPNPDQDVVDDDGAAAGLTYDDDMLNEDDEEPEDEVEDTTDELELIDDEREGAEDGLEDEDDDLDFLDDEDDDDEDDDDEDD